MAGLKDPALSQINDLERQKDDLEAVKLEIEQKGQW